MGSDDSSKITLIGSRLAATQPVTHELFGYLACRIALHCERKFLRQ